MTPARDAPRKQRRVQSEDSIYGDASKNRYVEAVT